MRRIENIIFASVGVFIGALLSDVFLGDGIQADDIGQALMVAAIAALIQAWLTRRGRG